MQCILCIFYRVSVGSSASPNVISTPNASSIYNFETHRTWKHGSQRLLQAMHAEDALIGNANTLLVAGSETTATALSGGLTWYLLRSSTPIWGGRAAEGSGKDVRKLRQAADIVHNLREVALVTTFEVHGMFLSLWPHCLSMAGSVLGVPRLKRDKVTLDCHTWHRKRQLTRTRHASRNLREKAVSHRSHSKEGTGRSLGYHCIVHLIIDYRCFNLSVASSLPLVILPACQSTLS